MPRTGFTLVEVMVATVVLSVSLLAIFGTMSVAQRSAVRAECLRRAVDLAERKLVDLMAHGYVPWGVSQGTFDHRFRWKAEITPGPDGGLLTVRVVVTWDERGTVQAHRLNTVVVVPSEGVGAEVP